MIPKYKKVLFATDLTPNSEHAFKHAVMMARCHEADIHLLHVVPDIEASVRSYISAVMGKGKLEQFEQDHEEDARREMKREIEELTRQELADHPEERDRIQVEVVHGDPVARILQTADQIGADVIVLGTHGKGHLGYSFLGSVTEKVLRKSHRPVLAIPLAP